MQLGIRRLGRNAFVFHGCPGQVPALLIDVGQLSGGFAIQLMIRMGRPEGFENAAGFGPVLDVFKKSRIGGGNIPGN